MVGKLISFNTCSNANRPLLQGIVFAHEGLGLAVMIDETPHELKKLINVKISKLSTPIIKDGC